MWGYGGDRTPALPYSHTPIPPYSSYIPDFLCKHASEGYRGYNKDSPIAGRYAEVVLRTFLIVLAYAFLPAAAVSGGGLLSEVTRVSRQALDIVLHAVAGTTLAIVAVQLLPRALAVTSGWLAVLSFIAGGLLFILIDYLTDSINECYLGARGIRSSLVLFIGVAVDVIVDGLTIGAGSAVELRLGLLLSLGITLTNIPEGFATIGVLGSKGMPKHKRMLASGLLGVLVILGAAGGYWILSGQAEWLKMSLLIGTAGFLTTLVVESITPEAHVRGDVRLAAVVFVIGFALFTLISHYMA